TAAADRTADTTVGRKATKGVQPPETAEAAQQPRRKAVEEIACSSCEQTNPPHARFCLRCGSRLQAGAACPECGVALPEDARFCTACGVAIPV
ncbi:MAG: zinc-ribbon domain-containing protein, partial [Acidobacteriota bacterium]